MSNRFIDRTPEFPGRVKITKVQGSNDQYIIEKDEGRLTGFDGDRQLKEGTPLDAATLNQFEDDLKHFVGTGIPVYTAKFEDETTGLRNYRISNINWDDIPLGSFFSIKLGSSTQGSSNSYIALKFGTSNVSGIICYNNLDTPGNNVLMRVDNKKFLSANVPYLFKKNNANLVNTGIVLIERYDTSTLGASIETEGSTLHLKNLEGSSISSVSLPDASGAGIPIYNAIKETDSTYRISNLLLTDLKLGSTFMVVLDASTQGTSNASVFFYLGAGTTNRGMHWNNPGSSFASALKINNTRYLRAGFAYLVKVTQMVNGPLLTIVDQFAFSASDVGAIASTDKGAANGVAPLGGDGKVPAANLAKASSVAFGVAKVWQSGTTLYIQTN